MKGNMTEGFICPLCRKSFETQEGLMEHYTEIHADSSEHANPKCPICSVQFSSFLNRSHQCCCCFRHVCGECSPSRWHKSCLPDHHNLHKRTTVRVCVDCCDVSTKFHSILEQGDLALARSYFKDNCRRLFLTHTCPVEGKDPEEDQLSYLHAAARSGKINILRWLVEEHKCVVGVLSGKDAIGPFEVAALQGHFECALYLHSRGSCEIKSTKVAKMILRDALDNLLFATETRDVKRKKSQQQQKRIGEKNAVAETAESCLLCNKAFSVIFNRQHTCALCEARVCNACSPHRWHRRCVEEEISGGSVARVCTKCHEWTKTMHMHIAAGDLSSARGHFRRREVYQPCYFDRPSPFVGDKPLTQLFTPLHAAAASGAVDVMRWLVEDHEVNVRARCAAHSTPLETAAMCGNLNAVIYLFGKGSSLDEIRSDRTVRKTLDDALHRLKEVRRRSLKKLRNSGDRRRHKHVSGKDMFKSALDLAGGPKSGRMGRIEQKKRGPPVPPPLPATLSNAAGEAVEDKKSERVRSFGRKKETRGPPRLPTRSISKERATISPPTLAPPKIPSNSSNIPQHAAPCNDDDEAEAATETHLKLRALSALFEDMTPDKPSPRMN